MLPFASLGGESSLEQAQLKEWEEEQPDKVLPLLQVVSDLVTKRADRFLNSRFTLTIPQYQLLLAAMTQADTTLGGLSEHLNCSRGNVTGIVDRLERDGWLARERSSEDRRVITVRLTDKGRQILEVQREVTKELMNLAEIWSPDERQDLMHILARMFRELKEE